MYLRPILEQKTLVDHVYVCRWAQRVDGKIWRPEDMKYTKGCESDIRIWWQSWRFKSTRGHQERL